MIQQRTPFIQTFPSSLLLQKPPIMDILVVNAADFLCPIDGQVELVQRISDLTLGTRRSYQGIIGVWILLMIHTSPTNDDERSVASCLTTTVCNANFPWIWGVRTVEESTPENTGQAALSLHRLHFPRVKDKDRPKYIHVLGSMREKNIQVHTPADRR